VNWVQFSLTSSLMIWMMGHSVLSASLAMTQNWEERLIHHRVKLPSRRTLACWSNGLTRTSRSSAKESAKSCAWGGATPCTICWELPGWKAALQERAQGSWWRQSWTGASNVPLLQRQLTASWAAWGGLLPAGQGRWSFPSTEH